MGYLSESIDYHLRIDLSDTASIEIAADRMSNEEPFIASRKGRESSRSDTYGREDSFCE